MAKCTITFEDDEESGETVIKGLFEPTLDKSMGLTPAQEFAYAIMREVAGGAGSMEAEGE